MRPKRNLSNKIAIIIPWLLLIAFIASIVWSFWFETLQPLIRAGDRRTATFNLIGFPILLTGMIIFVYGGWIFVLDTLRLFSGDKAFVRSVEIVREKSPGKDVKSARLENVRTLWRTWQRGLRWLGFGAGVFVIGGIIINM
ncbi:MAG: hypothetical protein NTV38_03515 [Chloroflexi bacterium]|nr:hypothetical protein [Chloroflexota bacterium]